MKIPLVEAQLYHAHGQTGRQGKAISLSTQFCELDLQHTENYTRESINWKLLILNVNQHQRFPTFLVRQAH